MTEDEREWLERLQADCLSGKAGGRAQKIVTDRCGNVLRVTGVTVGTLKKQDPARYERLLLGHRRALLRASLLESGQLSRKEVERMWQRELQRRAAAEFNDWDPTEAA